MYFLLASISLRLTSKASIAALPAEARSPMSLSKLAIALLKPSLAFSCSFKEAVFSAIAALLASMSWRLASKASAAALPANARSPMSLSKLAIALLKPLLASPCASNNALLAFTSALMALTTSAVFTNASLLSLTVAANSNNASSCSVTTSFKPTPSKSAFSTSSFVAVRMTFEPSSLATTIWSPSLKPLSSRAFSIVANAACAAAFCAASTSDLSALVSIAALLASISWRLTSKASIAALAKISTPLLALSAFSATASILEAASTALSAASLASFTLLSILAESSVTLSSAALAEALAAAVSCSKVSTRVFTAVTSSPIASNWSEISSPIAVISSAIFLLLLAMVFFSSSTSWSTALSRSSKASSTSLAKLSTRVLTAVIRPAKPTPFRLSASISALVASRMVLSPLSSVVMKFEPEAKPLMVCSNSKVFTSRGSLRPSLSFLKVSLPVSLSYVVFSPKTVANAACPWSALLPTAFAKFTSAAPAAPLATAAVTAMLNTFTLNFFMFFTFVWWV